MDKIKEELYPTISNKLINRLKRDYPDILPTGYISEFELGRLIGKQDIIKKLEHEKEYSENNYEP